MTDIGRKRVVYGVFVGAIVLGLVARPWERPRHDQSGQPDETGVPLQAGALTRGTAAALPASRSSSQAGRVFAAAWPADPFRRERAGSEKPLVPSNGGSSEPSFRLQGIMVVAGERVCVMNGLVVKAGGTVNGWNVARVEDHDVWLARGRQTIRVSLP